MRFAVALLLLALAPAAANAADDLDRALQDIVAGRQSGNALAGAVIAVKVGDKIVYAGAAGCAAFEETEVEEQRCRRKLTTDTKVRVASISKVATAMTALALEKEGLLDLDADISGALGWTLRNPAFPAAPITARQLMTHLSSLRDPEEYWVAAPGDFRALIEKAKPFAAAAPGGSRAPGAYFTYANINYGVLATALERASGERFDRLVASRVLAPLGIDAGFNWSGVTDKARREGATLYRTDKGKWIAQTDGDEILGGQDPLFLAQEGLDGPAYLATYAPGSNATLFSPQGGLRASVFDLLKILAARGEIEIVWRLDPQAENGDPAGGFYPAAGIGSLAVKGEARIWPGAELYGHSGEAYGLMAGLWRVPADPAAGRAQEVSFAYAITGASSPPKRGAHKAFFAVEEPLVRLAMAAAAEAGIAVDDEPRPFDQTRKAMEDVDAALAAAKAAEKNVLLVLGGNWCHDSRSFAMKLQNPATAPIVEAGYKIVYVDVGRRNRNLDVPKRFGVHSLIGTPTILVLSAEGALLNADTVHDWRNAADRSISETMAYLDRWADAE
ncbi:MAG: serine hydrolase [Parvularculaceae bacterium]